MMTYIKIGWSHSLKNEPVEMLSELDANRMETKKVDRFRDGVLHLAGPDVTSGDASLAEVPLPTLDSVHQDPQFKADVIEADEFEQAWEDAMSCVAA